MFSISEFVAQLDEENISRKSHYTVLITGPQQLQGLSQERDMTFRCDHVTEPGRNILTTSNSYHYGLPLSRAYGSSFSDITISFIMSEDNREKLYFERWMDLMIGPYRNGQISKDMFDIKYFDDYVGTAILYKYNDNGILTYSQKFINVFPLLVADGDLSWDSPEVNRLSVRLYYQYYQDEPTSG